MADLVEHTSVAICSNTLLNCNLHREDVPIFVGTNNLPWASTKQVAFLCLLVAAKKGMMLHGEGRRHQHCHILALQLLFSVAEQALHFLQSGTYVSCTGPAPGAGDSVAASTTLQQTQCWQRRQCGSRNNTAMWQQEQHRPGATNVLMMCHT